MKYYHATTDDNVIRIKSEGLNTGADGCSYLASNIDTAAVFLHVRGLQKFSVLEIDLPDTFPVTQSTDHDEQFFRSICPNFGESYFIETHIPPKYIKCAYHIMCK